MSSYILKSFVSINIYAELLTHPRASCGAFHLMQGCMENGKDATAVDANTILLGHATGLRHCRSLATIKYMVLTKKSVRLELYDAVMANWRARTARQYILNEYLYGNNDPSLTSDGMESHCVITTSAGNVTAPLESLQ